MCVYVRGVGETLQGWVGREDSPAGKCAAGNQMSGKITARKNPGLWCMALRTANSSQQRHR